jgi:ribosome-associated translation inhibitor RaiA
MDVLINTDNRVVLNSEARAFIEGEVDRALGRFSDRVTRAEVYLSDENADKGGPNDKRCVIEVRPSSMQPVSASDKASTVEEATTGAAQKMRRQLDSTFGRVDQR